MVRLKFLLIVALVGTSACKSTGFASGKGKSDLNSSSASKGNGNADADSGTPATPGGQNSDKAANKTDATCDSKVGKTSAVLLTKEMKNNAPDQFIKYKIALMDCDGKALPLKKARLGFDLNGALDPQGVELPYDIVSQSNKSLASGMLSNINGSDLFGHVGTEWSHWETTEVFFEPDTTSVELSIDVSNISVFPVSNDGTPLPASSSYTIDTHWKLGDALLVTSPITITQ